MEIKSLPTVILILFLVAITIGIGATVLYELGEKTVPSTGVLNDTLILDNATASSLDYIGILSFTGCVDNSTAVLGAANYSVDKTAGTLTFLTDDAADFSELNGTMAECNYSRKHYEHVVYTSQNATITAIADFAGWLKIIVIVIAAAIIIGLIMLFRSGGER